MNRLFNSKYCLLVGLILLTPGLLICQLKDWNVQNDDAFEVSETRAVITINGHFQTPSISCDELLLDNILVGENPPQITIDGKTIKIGLMTWNIDRIKKIVFVENNTQSELSISFKQIVIEDLNPTEPANEGIREVVTGNNKYPVYDALKLAEILTDTVLDISARNKIYAKYGIDPNNLNSFLVKFSNAAVLHASTGSTKNTGTSPLSSLGGLDVTKYADGIAKFLVKRTKEELSISFFRKFQTYLKGNKDLQSLFPQSYSGLSVIGEEIYNYQQYIGTLREQFENDLKLLPDHFPRIVDNHADYFDAQPAEKALVISGSYFARSIRDNVHPGKVIKEIPAKEFTSLNQDLTASIETFQLFSEAFKAKEDLTNQRYWVDQAQVKKIISDLDVLRIFLGLFLEEARMAGTKFEGGKLHDILEIVGNNFNEYENDFKQLFMALSEQHNRISLIRANHMKQNNGALDFDKLLSYFDASVQLIGEMKRINKLLPEDKKLSEESLRKIDQFIVISRTSSNLVVNVNKRKYSAAIVSLTELMDTVMTLTNVFEKDLQKKLLKYGSFMASMAQAEDSDEVAAVIESFALPSGSARIKRESSFNVALNAYLGVYGGWEKSRYDENDSWDGIFGLTAPVGISISHGGFWKGKKEKRGGKSISVFLSLIDIGAISSFRFTNDSLDVPKIYLKEIISPGAFVSFGFGKLPISFNAGYQISPRLRRIGMTENEVDLEYHGRISVSFVVDIPLLNFYTKTKD
jgi:hypothetical protein